MNNWRNEAYFLLVSGKKSCGKTEFWARYVIHTTFGTTGWNGKMRSVPKGLAYVFDSEGEFSDRFGFPSVTTLEGLDVAHKRALEGTGSPIIAFDPVPLYAGRLTEGFEFFSQWVFEVSKENDLPKIFAVDELQNFVSDSYCPESFGVLWDLGRRYGIKFAVIAQAPNLIHNRIRNGFTELATFQHIDDNAIKFLKSNGFDPEEIRGLRKLEWILRNMGTGEFHRGSLSF